MNVYRNSKEKTTKTSWHRENLSFVIEYPIRFMTQVRQVWLKSYGRLFLQLLLPVYVSRNMLNHNNHLKISRVMFIDND